MGRASVDIIKSGGYKISALDIERVLLSHPQISECAVVGIPNLEWGQTIGVIVVLKDEKTDFIGHLKIHSKIYLRSGTLKYHEIFEIKTTKPPIA